MHGAELKANSFNRQIELLRARLGEQRFAELERALSAETRALIANPPLPMGWVPVERGMELLETALAVSFGGREQELFEFGREQLRGDMWLRGDHYLTQMAVPNFYFHVTTAYSILRHNGVDVGKMDFLGNMPVNPA